MGLFDLFKKKDAAAEPTPDIAGLIAELTSGDVQRKIAACRRLAQMGPRAQAAVPALMELLHDDDGDLCNAAAAALSAIER